MTEPYRAVVVIPVYNHGRTAGAVVDSVRKTGLPVILIDDGSGEDTRSALAGIAEATGDCSLVRLERNSGKGGAVIAGLREARKQGYTHALQVDADGQHDLDRAAFFLQESSARPDALVAGAPEYDESAPASRLAGRKITNFWVGLETLSRDIPDAMCGFRVYPVDATLKALRAAYVDKRMGFDIEVLVRLHWLGVPLVFHPIRVDYPEDGTSNFRMIRDNLGISLSHTKLFLGMILRLPLLLIRRALRTRR